MLPWGPSLPACKAPCGCPQSSEIVPCRCHFTRYCRWFRGVVAGFPFTSPVLFCQGRDLGAAADSLVGVPMPRLPRYVRTPADRRRLAAAGKCIDCGNASRPLRVTGESPLRERTHHRCHSCYRIWIRRRALWDRIMRARAHARAKVSRDTVCSVCRFVVPADSLAYFLVPSPPGDLRPTVVCQDPQWTGQIRPFPASRDGS